MTEPRRLGRRDFVTLVLGGTAVGPLLVDCAGDGDSIASPDTNPGDSSGLPPDTVSGGDDTVTTLDTEGAAEVTPADVAQGDTSAGSDAAGDDVVAADTSDVTEEVAPPDVAPVDAFTLDGVPVDDGVWKPVVQAGSPTQTSIALWCFTTATTPSVVVWPTGHAKTDVITLPVTPAEGYVTIKVGGLTPGTRYTYAFIAGTLDAPGSRTVYGQFLTPHAETVSPIVVAAATSCTKIWYKPYPSLSLVAEHGFDVFLHLGDMSYNDDATTQAKYRELWHEALDVQGHRDLLPKGALLQTWDDHEIANNDWTTLDPARVEAGINAFFEAVPVLRDEGGHLWKSVRYGRTVEFFVLDCRSERKPDTKTTPDAEFISKAQFDWLTKALTDSPCVFKVIMNSVPIAAFPIIWPTDDVWAGYPAQRNALLDHVTNNHIDGVLFVTGDHHFGSLHHVERTGARYDLWEILAGPGASTPNVLIGTLELAPDLKEATVPSDQFLYYSLAHAATYLTFDPDKKTVDLEFVEAATGSQLFQKTLSF